MWLTQILLNILFLIAIIHLRIRVKKLENEIKLKT